MTAAGLEVRLHEGRGRAEAARVARTLNEVVASLQEIDRVHLLRTSRVHWVMADMDRQARDLVMRLEPRSVPAKREASDVQVPPISLVEGAAQLQQVADVPRLFMSNTVQRVGRLAEPRDGVESVSLSTYGVAASSTVVLDDAVASNAREAVRSFEISYGSVRGMLSTLGDGGKRRGVLRVSIRTQNGTAVEGVIQDSMTEELRRLWRHRVLLGGRIRRNARGQAISIEADQIERLPDDDLQRPRPSDLVGSLRGMLAGTSVDEFVGRLRD